MAQQKPTPQKHFAVEHVEGKGGKSPHWSGSLCSQCASAVWIYRELKTDTEIAATIQCHCTALAMLTCDAKLSSFQVSRGINGDKIIKLTKAGDSLPVIVCGNYEPNSGKR